jgi:predicted metal-dependent hydrolase
MRFVLRAFTRPDEPAEVLIDHGGRTYPVALRRSARARRISLRVSQASRQVVLTLPPRARIEHAIAFAREHGGWIASRVERLPERIPFMPGALVPVRGIAHRVMLAGTSRGLVSARDEATGPALIVPGAPDHVARRVEDHLRREARGDLEVAVRLYAGRLGRDPRRIVVKDTRSRWGSCSAAGVLSFSWRLILAPPLVLDYLAAHEVAHLEEMNHSRRYWRLLRDICPTTDEAERWLKAHGASLHRFG